MQENDIQNYYRHNVPESYLHKWQSTVDIMARIFEVPAGLIMRVHASEIEVLVSSHTDSNPYAAGAKENLNTGLYCETVMATRAQLLVPNALRDSAWKDNPDVKLNMTFYLGVPLVWPDGSIFGTICVLDEKERQFARHYHELLWHFKEVVEADFRLINQLEEQQSALVQAREEWGKTFHSIGDAVLILDTEMRIVRANQFACRLLDTANEELVGRPCYEGIHGGAQACPGCPVVETIRDLQPHSAEIEHQKYKITCLVSSSPILDEKGELTSIALFAKDITNQKKLERQLRQSQKMEAIGTLASGIAHDFNNILTPIMGYADMALEALPPDSPAAADIEQVLKAAGRARELVKQILTFSRQAEQELQPLKIHYVIKEALRFIRSSIPTTIEIRQNIDPECGAVLADPIHINQIIMNLCTNAYHAMFEKGGVLGVELQPVEMGQDDLLTKMELRPGRYVRLAVSDTGCGMDKIVLERIFDPYYTTKAPGKGTGLGLSVVHGIVKTLQGGITVYSEPGKGTVFHVYFPVIDTEAEETAERDVGQHLPTGEERILVVDDEKMIVALERQILCGLGYKVSCFTSCEEALDAFREAPASFDLIITDMTMPNMTGMQLAREVFSCRPDMPVILCTGFSELINEDKAKSSGVSEFVMKPIIKKDLALAVRRVLD